MNEAAYAPTNDKEFLQLILDALILFLCTYRICVVVLKIFSILHVKTFKFFSQFTNSLLPTPSFKQDGARLIGGSNREAVRFQFATKCCNQFLIVNRYLAVVGT